MTIRSLLGLGAALWSLALVPADITTADRMAAIRRAQVWTPSKVAAFDFTAGDGEFAPGATVACDYSDRRFGGNSPKFACVLSPGD